MGLIINNNLMAKNAANALNQHFRNLGVSTQRLSSGLRINSAADDAAGLAIRALQRAEIATLKQGARNINDAISMIQTADGALAVIDEKLIRMKELAEQAATGTYNSTQRMLISSEFQAMAAEIDRIATATAYNGIHLLNGHLLGAHNGENLASTGQMKIHFGNGNEAAEDYYYISIGDCTVNSLVPPEFDINWPGAQFVNGKIEFVVTNAIAGTGPNAWGLAGATIDSYRIPSGLVNVTIESKEHITPFPHKPHVSLFATDGTQLTGYEPATSPAWWNNYTNSQVVGGPGFEAGAVYTNMIINNAGQMVTHNGLTVVMESSQNETPGWERMTIAEVTDDLLFLLNP